MHSSQVILWPNWITVMCGYMDARPVHSLKPLCCYVTTWSCLTLERIITCEPPADTPFLTMQFGWKLHISLEVWAIAYYTVEDILNTRNSCYISIYKDCGVQLAVYYFADFRGTFEVSENSMEIRYRLITLFTQNNRIWLLIYIS